MGEMNGAHLEHPALLYSSTEDFLAYMVPYVRAGLDADEVVFVAARADNLAALRSEIGPRGDAAGWADTKEWHPHTGTRLRAFHELVTDQLAAGATSIRLAGEPVWPAGPSEFVREWQRYESALNNVLAPFPVTLVCLYDAARLDPSILATARVTHPTFHQGAPDQPSGDFETPEEFLARWNAELPPPPRSAARMSVLTDLASARRFLREQAIREGVPADRATDLCFAANEAVTNAIVHGNGVADLWAWEDDGRFMCQVEDRGPGIGDPLAGYRPPSGESGSGRGLWLARQLVDLLQVVPGRAGTTVRLHVRLA
jgi:anti-sigma regulatory factor (Ser/Thr protein kinase)